MNFGDLKDVAIGQVAGASQHERLSDVGYPFAGAMLNIAYHKIEREALWKFSEAEVTLTIAKGSQVPTSPPTDIAVPLMARNVKTRRDLEFHDSRQRFHHSDDPKGTEGRVNSYGIWAGTLRFFPAASQEETISLRYYKQWADLSADADEPIIPPTWHDLLSEYASARIALRLPPVAGKYLPESAARPFQESWENGLAAMVASDLVLPSWDAVHNHALMESMAEGEGVDW